MSDMSSFDSVIADLEKAGGSASPGTQKSSTSFDTVINDLESASRNPTKFSQPTSENKSMDSSYKNPAESIRSAFLPKEPYKEKYFGQQRDVGALETAANVTSGIGANIIGGWRGLYELAKGGPDALERSAAAVGEEQQNRTYQPETEIGKNLTEAANLPGEMVGKAAGYMGGKALDVTGSPAVATAVETGLNAAPMLLGLKKGANAAIERPAVASDASSALKKQFENVKNPISEVAKSEGALPIAEQNARAQILSRVGIDEARKSSLTGEAKSAASDFQQSKLDNPGGDLMRRVFDKEKQALQTHAEKIINDTGGSVGMSEDNLHARGTSIASPFDAIRDVMSEARKNLYAKADEAAAGNPSVSLSSLQDFLKKDSAFEGVSERGDLRKGIRAYLKEQNIIQPDGSLSPITAKSAEGLRQYINEQWSPKTSGLAGKIKGLIDEDVLDKGGTDLYKGARELHKQMKDTLDNPNGISKLMDYDPRNPINRSVPYEKIPDFVTRLPADQFQHIISVLKNAPSELAGPSTAAIGEIKSHIVNKILDEGNKYKGAWNAKGVEKVLKDNSKKIEMIFTPEEMAKLGDLNEAGKILQVDTGYPGAAVQQHNLLVRNAINALPAAGAGAGAYVGGTLGAAVGAGMGTKLAGKIEARSSLSSAQKRLTKISDMPGVKK